MCDCCCLHPVPCNECSKVMSYMSKCMHDDFTFTSHPFLRTKRLRDHMSDFEPCHTSACAHLTAERHRHPDPHIHSQNVVRARLRIHSYVTGRSSQILAIPCLYLVAPTRISTAQGLPKSCHPQSYKQGRYLAAHHPPLSLHQSRDRSE